MCHGHLGYRVQLRRAKIGIFFNGRQYWLLNQGINNETLKVFRVVRACSWVSSDYVEASKKPVLIRETGFVVKDGCILRYYTNERACSRSAIMSLASSIPIDNRTKPSEIPAVSRASFESLE